MKLLPLHLPTKHPVTTKHPPLNAMRAIIEKLGKNKCSAFRKPEFIRGNGGKGTSLEAAV